MLTDRNDRVFFGHPRGLGFLASAEAMIGFSLYGMQALLVLYMTGELLRPGHVERVIGFAGFHAALERIYGTLSGQPLAAAIMGLYSAFIWATPILGGLVADKLLGRTRTIILGAVLMTAGHFLLAFDASFLIALLCLIAGLGCVGSLKAQVGGLYRGADHRRPEAFQIYTIALNLAVIVAPLVCGTLGEQVAWHWGFAAAGVGMLLGLVIYLAGRRWLAPEPAPTLFAAKGAGQPASSLTTAEWRRILLLVALLPVLAVAAVGNMEIFNGYLLWGKATYDLRLFGHQMPVTWLISLDAFVGTGTLIGSVLFWRWWAARRREPDEIVKMAIGAAISATAPLVLALASLRAAAGHPPGLGWGIGFHVLNDIGFSNMYPVGIALFSRAAPPRLGATLVNAYSLHLFLANLLVGYLAGQLSYMTGASFWLLHVALMTAASLTLLAFAAAFRGVLKAA